MEVPWPGTRCLLCLGGRKLSLEHVIPEALGGNLTCRFLCSDCNSRMGYLFEGQCRSDPTIQLSVAELAAEVPILAQRIREGQRYKIVGQGPASISVAKRGKFVTLAEKLADGSLIQDTTLAKSTVRRMLERDGLAAHFVEAALQRFEDAPDDTLLQLSPNVEVVKWSIAGFQPSLDGPLLNELVPTKSAFEFLALHLNSEIYLEIPPLAAVREALMTGVLPVQDIVVERLFAPHAKPFHGLLFEGNTPYAKVQVRLFGKLAFRVHFKRLSVAGARFMYTHELQTDEERVDELPSV